VSRKYNYITVKQFCARCDRIISRTFPTVNAAILGMREGSMYCMFCKEWIANTPDLFSSMKAKHNDEKPETEDRQTEKTNPD
jgi:hypothetical protein